MIELVNVSKVYQMGDEVIHAMDRVNLTINKGEFVSIIGASGSGKSTMMNIIGCLDVCDAGDYYFEGNHINAYSENELAKIRNEKIGFVFQNFNLLPQLTAIENVELPLIYQRVSASKRREMSMEALDKVGLLNRGDHKPTELSGGQQQRVSIARAMVTKAPIIMADEPTGALDSKTSEAILQMFRELHQQGSTVIMITHNDYIADQAQRKIFMLDGKASEVL